MNPLFWPLNRTCRTIITRPDCAPKGASTSCYIRLSIRPRSSTHSRTGGSSFRCCSRTRAVQHSRSICSNRSTRQRSPRCMSSAHRSQVSTPTCLCLCTRDLNLQRVSGVTFFLWTSEAVPVSSGLFIPHISAFRSLV